MYSRKGVSTIIGMLLLVIILLVFLNTLYIISNRFDTYVTTANQVSKNYLEQIKENILISNIYVTGNNTLSIELSNEGDLTVGIVGIWVNDTLRNYTNHPIYIGVGRKRIIDTGVPALYNVTYIIEAVTERGNIIASRWPKSIHIGNGAAEVPGGAGAANLIAPQGSWSNGQLKDVGVSTIKNVGSLAFKINFLTRIVFTSPSANRSYSGYLDEVENETTTKSIGPTTPSGLESMWIYPGDNVTLHFTMYERPPEGVYDVYLELVGYDLRGNFYTQSIYLGRYEISS